MKKLFKSWKVVAVIVSLLLTCFQIHAMKDIDEDIPMEGELGNYGMRSLESPQSAQAVLRGNKIDIEFFKMLPSVTINIKNTDNDIIYSTTTSFPHYETISLEGLESGCYTLELSTDKGYMYGTFMYIY